VLKPFDDRLETFLANTARDKGVEAVPLRTILVRLGEAWGRDEGISKMPR